MTVIQNAHHTAVPIHPARPCHTTVGQKPMNARMIQKTAYVEHESPKAPRNPFRLVLTWFSISPLDSTPSAGYV